MSKTITRKYIQRITKHEGNTNIRQSGGGGGGGGVSQYWVDDNYVSKEFFNRLFEIHDENGDPILPNDVETEIDNIQAMFGFWTNAYLSALGNNPGGGGAELTLASLADVAVQGVADGQALVWNAAQGKWVPGQGGGGSAEELTNKTVTASTLDGLAGSFTFEGNNLISSQTDYVGMQIGSAYDKIQIAGQEGSLMIRQNDNGGTSASGWTDWTMMLTASNYANYITGFVTLDTAQTINGTKTFSNTVFLNSISEPSGGNGLLVYKPASGWSGISSTQWGVGSADSQGVIRSSNTNLLHYKGGTSYTIWDESNDGANSGLDADLIDGHHATDFALASAITDMATKTWVGQNYLGLHATADAAAKLATPRTLWGQSFNGTANVSGDMSSVGDIALGNGKRIYNAAKGSGGSLYIGRSDDAGWVYMSDMCSRQGDGYWKVQSNGNSEFANVYSRGYVTALSDVRHKDIQGDVGLTVSEVANAPAVKFLWKDRRQEGLQVGSIAQYWQKVLPEAIVEAADGELTMSYGVIALLASIANAREIVNLKREIAELKRKLQIN